jgi:chromosome segregation ATPase
MRLAEAELSHHENEVAALKSSLSSVDDSEEITEQIETEEQLLADIITKIHKQREIEKELSRAKLTPPPSLTDSFAQEAQRAVDARLRKMSSVLQAAQQEVEGLTEAVQEEAQRAQLEADRKTCPPKISRGRSQIAILESSVAAASDQCVNGKAAVGAQKTRLENLTGQLDLDQHAPSLRRDLWQRAERSLNWLLPNVRKQKRSWSEVTAETAFDQLLTDWDLKIVNASVNEADDLAVRAAVLRPRRAG